MNFSSYLFWDIEDIKKIDFYKRKEYIIERVLQYGQMNDWQIIKNLYGAETIKIVALQIRSLDPKTLSFLSTIFEIPKTQFRCYTTELLNQIHWKY